MILPQSYEAEKGVLGSILVEEKCAPIALEILEERDFLSPKNREVFEAIKDLCQRGEPIDFITLANYLKTKKRWNGEVTYLTELAEFVPTACNISSYCEIVKSKSIAREFIALSYDSQKEVCSGERIEEVLEKFKESIIKIEKRKSGEIVEPVKFELYLKLINQRREGKRTGYSELDRWIDFNPSELNIIAGRTGHGKTFFLLNLLLNMYEVNQDEPFLFFSYEMDYEQIIGRILGILSQKYSMKEIRRCYKEKALYSEILEAQEKFRKYEENKNLFIIYDPNLTVSGIERYCSKVKEKFGKIGCVFVDYLQKVKTKEEFGTRYLQVAHITDRLRIISQILEAPIIAGAQIGRTAVKETKDKRPRLEDLREAGDIEQDSTIVLGLYNRVVQEKENSELGNPSKDQEEVDLEVWILKNRHGVPSKKVELEFNMRSGKISEISEEKRLKSLRKF